MTDVVEKKVTDLNERLWEALTDNVDADGHIDQDRSIPAMLATLTPGSTWTTEDGVEVMVVPVEATEEMVRRHLAQEWPALFKTHLRHPDNGPSSRKETESRIGLAVRKWAAMLSAIRKE